MDIFTDMDVKPAHRARYYNSTGSITFETPEEDPTIWISQNGTKTHITDMNHSHLMNALKKVESEGMFDLRYANLLKEAISRGFVKTVVTTLT